ncbi:MAG: ABC transporter permease [Acidobacteria bacterium]|nr:MAG: ABC transporter permease [Acidobacteriota bacterium]
MPEWTTALWLRLKALRRRHALDRDLRDELEFHRAMRAEQPGYRFGNDVLAQEASRELWTFAGLESVLRDVRYAGRQIRRSSGFAAVAILTLALGLGATTAIFSVVNGVLLQPLAYRNPKQLVALELYVPKLAKTFPTLPIAPADFLAWSQAKTLAGIAEVDGGEQVNLTGAGRPALLDADGVSANLFRVLGVTPELGPGFSQHADQAGYGHEVVLTNALWRSRFHADAGIVGRGIALNGASYTVVGVLPAAFHFPAFDNLIRMQMPGPKAALFVPFVITQENLHGNGLAAIARLKPGVSEAEAVAELNSIVQREPNLGAAHATTILTPLRSMIAHAWRRALWMLLAAVLAVLLLICVNLANLALTRASARQPEAAIRSALGASRGRLLRQALIESLLLGLAGGALGVALAAGGFQALLALAPAGMPRTANIHLGGTVLLVTLGASLLAGLLAGVLPAWRMAQGNPQEALRASSARAGESGARLRLRGLLVGGGTALSTVLLIGAGLLLTSFTRLANAPTGFAVEQVLTANLQLPTADYGNGAQKRAFWNKAMAEAAKLPGVQAAAATTFLPLSGTINDNGVWTGAPAPGPPRLFASYRPVSPEFFHLLGISLIEGRELTAADAGSDAVVISQAAAQEIWPGLDPIGQRFDVRRGFTGYRVVGVVANTRAVSLAAGLSAVIYQPFKGYLSSSLLLRTALPAATIAPELRRALAEVDQGVAVPPLRSMGAIVAASLAPRRFGLLLMALFAGAALLLACLGIYGVVSYSVVQRKREVGMRMALGAQRGAVVRMMIGQGIRPALIGLGVGLLAAAGLARVLASVLYGVAPDDPRTFAAVAAMLAAVALLSCWVPAGRAARVDPAVALRQD